MHWLIIGNFGSPQPDALLYEHKTKILSSNASLHRPAFSYANTHTGFNRIDIEL